MIISDLIEGFFIKVSCKDSALLYELKNNSKCNIDNDSIKFTLPHLYQFFKRFYCFEEDHISYIQFRKTLFNLNINQMISVHSSKIDIAKNNKNVDKSVYKLIWI